jgi:uncharacterized membrane protein YgcG
MLRTVILAAALALAAGGGTASAQRGMGESEGVAPDVTYDPRGLRGEIAAIEVGACANTTGRAVEGAHLIVAMPDGQDANVHLGPTRAESVGRVLDAVEVGDEVRAEVFRTDVMPFGTFAAVTVTVDGETVRLRAPNLRPDWAMGPGGAGAGRGDGRGAAARDGSDGGGGRAGGGGRCWWDVPTGQ